MKNFKIIFLFYYILFHFIIKSNLNTPVLIVLAVNNYYVPYVSVMIESLIYNSNRKRSYKLFILNTNISQKNKENLKLQIKKNKNFSIDFINVNKFLENKNLNLFYHLTIETYFRFLIFDLFPNSEKVLYLDSDLIINVDVSILYDINIKGKYLAASKDIDTAGSFNYQFEKRKYIKDVIGYNASDEYFQAGVILFNVRKIRKKFSSEVLFYIAQARKWELMDQDILNFLFKGNIYYLNQKWNCLMNWVGLIKNRCRIDYLKLAPKELFNEYLEARKNPLIIHYAGNQKPWETPNCDFSNYFWKYANKSIYINQIIKQNKKNNKKKIFKLIIKNIKFKLRIIFIINSIIYLICKKLNF
jgi:lipopolysaccharide biosynthesis glycosyltransferase